MTITTNTTANADANLPTAPTASDYTQAARRVVDHERKSDRRAADYDALAATFNLSAESSSDIITAAARRVTIDGEAALGRLVTIDDLRGSNPGEDSPVVTSWRAARAVRKGLVLAIARQGGATEDDDAPKVPVIRVSLSGKGGGTVVIEESHELYATLRALVTGDAAGE